MNIEIQQVALRNGALFLVPSRAVAEPANPENPGQLSKSTIFCLTELLNHGFTLDEKALRMLNRLSPEDQADVLKGVHEVFNTDLNWTPLVKGWSVPTHESFADQLITFFYNIGAFDDNGDIRAVTLPCGHKIPEGTFDLSRYNGCPFCGKPFVTNDFVFFSQGSKIQSLTGWGDKEATRYLSSLLTSTVPLLRSQIDDLGCLLEVYDLPDVEIPMRETAIVVASNLLMAGDVERIQSLLLTPNDLLRMIWFENTGHLKIIRPSLLVLQAARDNYQSLEEARDAAIKMKRDINLKFSRTESKVLAKVLNDMDITPGKACEIMNPYRGMWVRVIRALRLAEYAKRKGFERLRQILDLFYRKDYVVLQGLVDQAVDMRNFKHALSLLSQRPGVFARQLFSMMLRTNPYTVLAEFKKVVDKLPLRLIFDLVNNAEIYFSPVDQYRTIRTIMDTTVSVPINPNLERLPEQERKNLISAVRDLALYALEQRYAAFPMPGRKIYIDPALLRVVLPVGDRSKALDGVLVVPQGTTFPVLGDKVRIFLHWGKGLPAQPMDLDISAKIIYNDSAVDCAYFNLSPIGAKHSGDMRQIPDEVGTAEYIELDLPALRADGALFVAFVANQYSSGKLQPNAMAGWMDSAFPMAIDHNTGVAYDPSCVQYLVKVPDDMLQKGLVFGVLDVVKNEIIWVVAPFDGRNILSLDYNSVLRYLVKLGSKVTIGRALEIMARARQMVVVDKDQIDDDTLVYDRKWAYNIADVTSVLLPSDTVASAEA